MPNVNLWEIGGGASRTWPPGIGADLRAALQSTAILTGALQSGGVNGWQLANYLPQLRPMRVITHRPEAGANAAHLWAHPMMPYDHAILVSGGAPPYYAVLEDAPTWMSDIQFLTVFDNELRTHVNYLRLYGATPSASGQPSEGWLVRYRVYGQDYGRGPSPTTYIEVSFRVRVDAGKFLFVATTGNNASSGSYESPKADFAGWYESDVNANTHFGRIVVFRGGTYDVVGQASNHVCRIDPTTKPRSFIGFHGETVDWDFSTGAFAFWNGTHDVLVQNIRTQGSYLDIYGSGPAENARNFAVYGTPTNRVYFDRCSAYNIQPGTMGDDNAGWLWHPNSTPDRITDYGFTQLHFENIGPGTSNLAAVSLSNSDYVVFNQVKGINCAGYKFLNSKSSSRWMSWLHCDLWEINSGSYSDNGAPLSMSMSTSYDSSIAPTGKEAWYCRVNSDSNNDVWGVHGDSLVQPCEMSYQRCSIRGHGFFYYLDNIDATARNCVIEGSITAMSLVFFNDYLLT